MQQIQQVSFGSTFVINLRGRNMTNGKRELAKNFAKTYENYLYPTGKTGNIRLSVPNSEDPRIKSFLSKSGIKEYQVYDVENVPREEIDKTIFHMRIDRDYHQKGKQKASKR